MKKKLMWSELTWINVSTHRSWAVGHQIKAQEGCTHFPSLISSPSSSHSLSHQLFIFVKCLWMILASPQHPNCSGMSLTMNTSCTTPSASWKKLYIVLVSFRQRRPEGNSPKVDNPLSDLNYLKPINDWEQCLPLIAVKTTWNNYSNF